MTDDAIVIGTGKWHVRRRYGETVSTRLSWSDQWGRVEEIIVETTPFMHEKSTEVLYPPRH
jgi:hypothetical protein